MRKRLKPQPRRMPEWLEDLIAGLILAPTFIALLYFVGVWWLKR